MVLQETLCYVSPGTVGVAQVEPDGDTPGTAAGVVN